MFPERMSDLEYVPFDHLEQTLSTLVQDGSKYRGVV